MEYMEIDQMENKTISLSLATGVESGILSSFLNTPTFLFRSALPYSTL